MQQYAMNATIYRVVAELCDMVRKIPGARVVDTANFKEEDLKPNPQFDFTLLCRMCWSKNVLEERDAPDQILLGSMNGVRIVFGSTRQQKPGAVAVLETMLITVVGGGKSVLLIAMLTSTCRTRMQKLLLYCVPVVHASML